MPGRDPASVALRGPSGLERPTLNDAQRMGAVVRGLRQVFSLDLRSLALYRVGLAALVVADLIRRAADFRAHYTDFGLLPRAALLEYAKAAGKWTVHLFSGGAPEIGALFILHGLFALAMLVGFRTRLATVLTFLLTVSLHHRNPLILQGGDAVVRLGLFWSMFMPLGARFSVDEALDVKRPRPDPQFASWGVAAFMLQIWLFYLMTGVLKWHPVWHTEGSGVRYALSLEAFATSWGHYLLSFPKLMTFASYATLWCELIAPFIVLLPFWGGRIRLAGALAFMAFHMILLEPALRLGFFTWAGACIWLAWLPGLVWDWWGRRAATEERLGLRLYYDGDCDPCRKLARIVRSLLLLPDTCVAPKEADPEIAEEIETRRGFVVVTAAGHRLYGAEALRALLGASPIVGWAARPILGLAVVARVVEGLCGWMASHRTTLNWMTAPLIERPCRLVSPRRWARRGAAAFLAFTFLYVLMWNIRTTDFKRYGKIFPRKWNIYAYVVGIEQYWNLFAPYPLRDDGWYVVPGVFKDGSVRDLYWDRSPLKWTKPPIGTAYYANQRWSKYMMNIWKKKHKAQRLNFGRWLCRAWNEDKPPGEHLQRLQIYFMRERTLKVGEERPKPVRIWRHYCTSKPDVWEDYGPEARAALGQGES